MLLVRIDAVQVKDAASQGPAGSDLGTEPPWVTYCECELYTLDLFL